MKKLKNWTIVTMIFCILFLALAIVCVVEPEGFGEWLVLTYEDMTCELGMTAEKAFDKLLIISFSVFAGLFVTNQILYLVYTKKLRDSAKITPETVKTAVKDAVREENQKKKRKAKMKEALEDLVVEQPKPVQPRVQSKDQEMKDFLDSLRK